MPQARDCYAVDWANAVDAEVTTIWSVDDRIAAVPCTDTHAFEVVTVATPGGTASASPPSPTSSTVRTTYQRCADDADAYLGGDWRGAYAWLGVAMPDPNAWQRGAHWSACVLVPTATWEGQLTQSRTSLDGGLRGSQPAAIRCIDDRSRPADCGGPHTREAVGVYRARSGPLPDAAEGTAVFRSACESKVALYLGLKSLTQYHNQAVGIFVVSTGAEPGAMEPRQSQRAVYGICPTDRRHDDRQRERRRKRAAVGLTDRQARAHRRRLDIATDPTYASVATARMPKLGGTRGTA